MEDSTEAAGCQRPVLQLAGAESALRGRINEKWLHRGVFCGIPSPLNTYVDADVRNHAPEVSLLPGTVLKGHCVIERGAQIGPNGDSE